MQPNSFLASIPYSEPAILEKKSVVQCVRSKRRLFNAIYKTEKNRLFQKIGMFAEDFPLFASFKKLMIFIGLSVLSKWHFIVRYFYYLIIFISRLISWISGPVIKAHEAVHPVLCKKYQDLIDWKDSFLHGPIGRLPAVAMIGAFTALILSVNYFGLGLEVYIDGKSVGFVSKQDDLESVIHSVENRSAFYLDHPYNLNINVDYQIRLMDKTKIINPIDLEKMLFSKVNEISTLYALTVDGKIIGANASKTAIQMILDKILAQYGSDDPNVKTEFVQDVSISEMPVANIYLKSASELTTLLKGDASSASAKTYTVQDGDTASGIALKCSLKLSELQALNPALNPDKISIGQKLNLGTSSGSSILSVKQIKQITYKESIPYDTITQESDSLYKNNKKVTVDGKPGEAEVSAEIVLVDGKEISCKVTNRVTVSEPVSQVVVVGTKDPPPKSPTGVFTYPFRGGLITSNYGWRNGGEFHTGVDFAGPIGSPIVAADGGYVVFAGWNGNYGKCIIVSHGNGLETLYGHCSSLLVSVGQQVGKGELIARVGSTGRATGPHLHFEIRVNGNYVSPWKYLK